MYINREDLNPEKPTPISSPEMWMKEFVGDRCQKKQTRAQRKEYNRICQELKELSWRLQVASRKEARNFHLRGAASCNPCLAAARQGFYLV